MRTIYRSDRHNLFYIISPCAKMTSDISILFTLQREQILYDLQYLNITYSLSSKWFPLAGFIFFRSFLLLHLFPSNRLLQVLRPAVQIVSLELVENLLPDSFSPTGQLPFHIKWGRYGINWILFGLLDGKLYIKTTRLNNVFRADFKTRSVCLFECHIFMFRSFSTCSPPKLGHMQHWRRQTKWFVQNLKWLLSDAARSLLFFFF